MYSSLYRHRWLGAPGPAHKRLRLILLLLVVASAVAGYNMADAGASVSPDANPEEVAIPTAMADLEAELGETVHLPLEVNERVGKPLARDVAAAQTRIARRLEASTYFKGRVRIDAKKLFSAPEEFLKEVSVDTGFKFRREDFRARMSVLQRAIALETGKPDSPFAPPDNPSPPEDLFTDRDESGVTGAYFKFEIPIKDSFQAFGPSTTFGSLARPRLQQELLAQGPGAEEVGR